MAMACLPSLRNCVISPNVLLTTYSLGLSSLLHPSSMLSSLTISRRWDAQSKFSIPGFLGSTQQQRSNKVYNVRAERPNGAGESRDAVDISVFRFTLGIPGFDDSDLPGLLGTVFGGLLILNHVFSPGTITAPQLRSEGVGLVLAAVSISLPYIGRQLNGNKMTQRQLEPGQKQIFSLADGLNDSQRQNLAWASYHLLRNTSSTAMLVWYSGQVIAARGFWGIPTDSGPDTQRPLEWLQQKLDEKLQKFSNLKEPLHISANADAQGWDIIPWGTASVLLQPFPADPNLEENAGQGFLLLISNTTGGYRRKDRKWTAFLAKKLSDVLSQ